MVWTSRTHAWYNAESLRIVAAMRAPWIGGDEITPRTSRLSCAQMAGNEQKPRASQHRVASAGTGSYETAPPHLAADVLGGGGRGTNDVEAASPLAVEAHVLGK